MHTREEKMVLYLIVHSLYLQVLVCFVTKYFAKDVVAHTIAYWGEHE